MEPHPTQPMFVALHPAPALDRLIQGYKDRTAALVGDQLFLEDPPHSTVYLAHFPPGADPAAALAPLADRPPPRVRLTGWAAFENDPLTARHTLIAAIHPDDKAALRELQAEVVRLVAPLRDAAATERHFRGRWQHLSEPQRAAVVDHGFPYLFAGWEPHFTVASIAPAAWAELRRHLDADPPHGEFACDSLRHYDLADGRPTLRGEVRFRTAG